MTSSFCAGRSLVKSGATASNGSRTNAKLLWLPGGEGARLSQAGRTVARARAWLRVRAFGRSSARHRSDSCAPVIKLHA